MGRPTEGKKREQRPVLSCRPPLTSALDSPGGPDRLRNHHSLSSLWAIDSGNLKRESFVGGRSDRGFVSLHSGEEMKEKLEHRCTADVPASPRASGNCSLFARR